MQKTAVQQPPKKLSTHEHKKIGPGQIILLILIMIFTIFCGSSIFFKSIAHASATQGTSASGTFTTAFPNFF